MRALIAIAVLAALGAAVVFWSLGGDRLMLGWAIEGQREAQTAMATPLRALRAGDPAALGPLMGVCFAYGFFHAAGPGHGKLLIGGYGAAREVGALRLSLVALAASLAQGLTAIALVGAGLWLLGLGREAMTDLAERYLQPLGFAAIAGIGLWLAARGARALAARSGQRTLAVSTAAPTPDHHQDHHDHNHDHGPDCGHAHGPAPQDVAAATSLRELLVLIAAVAIRPCTGALFLLVLTAQMGVFAVGVAGTIFMALGTASVTVAVALAAIGARRGLVTGLAAGTERLGRIQPAVEIAIGLVIAWIAGGLVLATL